MPNRDKSHKHHLQPRTGRGGVMLLTMGIFLLLAFVATLLWLISSPQLVKPN